jgi:pimeloyl-ACP methyl ester carboxylesterase
MNEDAQARPPRALKWATRACLLALMLLLAVRVLNAASMFPRLPTDTSSFSTKAKLLNNTREVRFEATDGTKLYGWVTGRDDTQRKIVFCCGNGGNVSGYGSRMCDVAKALDAQVLVFDYRGYYLSEGTPSEEGCRRDTRGAWVYATRELGWKPERTIIWGHSLGSAFATGLASDLEGDGAVFGDGASFAKPARALILESPLTSAAEMARHQFGFLGAPHWLAYAGLDNLSRVRTLKLPIFVMHGTVDEIIPYEMGREVAAACHARALWLESGNHNGLWAFHRQEITRELESFLGH